MECETHLFTLHVLPKICCFFKNLTVTYLKFNVIHSAETFQKEADFRAYFMITFVITYLLFSELKSFLEPPKRLPKNFRECPNLGEPGVEEPLLLRLSQDEANNLDRPWCDLVLTDNFPLLNKLLLFK